MNACYSMLSALISSNTVVVSFNSIAFQSFYLDRGKSIFHIYLIDFTTSYIKEGEKYIFQTKKKNEKKKPVKACFLHIYNEV